MEVTLEQLNHFKLPLKTLENLSNLWPSFSDQIEIWSVGFCGGRKSGEPEEKPSEQGRQPTKNSTQMWRRGRESNPGHSGGRRALSPLRHPCSPCMHKTCSSFNTQVWYCFNALFPFLCVLSPTTTTHACLNYAFMRLDRMKLLFNRSDFIAPRPLCIFQYTFPAKESTMVNLVVFTKSILMPE